MLSYILQILFVICLFFITSSLVLRLVSKLEVDFYDMKKTRVSERLFQQCYGLLAAKKNILDSADLLLQENILSTLEYRAAVDEALWLINSKNIEINCIKERLSFFKGYVFRQFHLGAPNFLPNWVVGYK